MNDQATPERPADAVKMIERPGASASAFRSRSPDELAQQLERNIKSLELTGSHLEPAKDQPFYVAVAADMREAAAFLRSWDTRLKAKEQRHREEIAAAREQVLRSARECAEGIHRLVEGAAGEPAAALAIRRRRDRQRPRGPSPGRADMSGAPMWRDVEPDDFEDVDGCTDPKGHEWAYSGTAYGGDDESYMGEGRCYCVHCGADGDA